MRKKFTISILVICILLSPYSINQILRSSYFFKASYVHSYLNGKNLDYVIIGSSRGLTTLNSNQIDSNLGLNGFNASTDGGGIATNILMLKHLINNNVKFKYCIFVLDQIGIEDNIYQFSKNTYRFVPFCNESYIQETINKFENSKEKRNFQWSRIYPGFTIFENNKTLLTAAIESFFNPQKRNRFDEKGNYTYPLGDTINQHLKFDTLQFSQFGLVYSDLKQICEANNIILITYIAPIKSTYLKLPEIMNLINHSKHLKNASFFADDLHVNSFGREVATDSFCRDFRRLIK